MCDTNVCNDIASLLPFLLSSFSSLFCMPPQLSLALVYIAWTSVEVVRFPWLLQKQLSSDGTASSILNYLRYTLFIVLYPLGGVGEAWTMYSSMEESKNGWEHMPLVIKYVYFTLFFPGFFFLYTHMLKQRKKRLGGGSSRSSKSTENQKTAAVRRSKRLQGKQH